MHPWSAAALRFPVERPVTVLAALALVVAFFAYFAPQFKLDASADSLLLENDRSLRYYRGIRARYGSDDYLVVTWTPRGELFAPAALARLEGLRDALREVPGVASVTSILDVPLLESPPLTLDELQAAVPTLEDLGTDPALARAELVTSPIYSELLVSRDARTAALLVTLELDPTYDALLRGRDVLRELDLEGRLDAAGERVEALLGERIRARREVVTERQRETIARIRSILDGYRDEAEIRLGGLPMIVVDMLDYVLADVVVFGAGIVAFLTVLLAAIFARARWVLLPMACCLVSALVMTGLLGLAGWPVTVVSANFVALLLIFSLSLTVHLVVRYRELHALHPEATQAWLVAHTVEDKFRPCAYTAATTMVAFASLTVSDIRPVIDFGWMMVIGMGVVLGLAFTLFPACLALLPVRSPQRQRDLTGRITGALAGVVERFPKLLLAVCGAIAVLSLAGLGRLEVENRFIDNFRPSTEIYQGLVTIDRELGGTTPLDVIIDAPAGFAAADAGTAAAGEADEFEEFEEFEDFEALDDGEPADLGATSYWYNTYRLGTVGEVHEYLESLPETGKVLSMHTAMQALAALNEGETPGTFFLSLLYKRLPADVRAVLVDPYLSGDGNQVRFSVRVFESDPTLRRAELLERIRTGLIERFGFAPEQVRLTGMLVLYNNVLQSLYRSQVLTLGFVFLAILAMFVLLFRSLPVALVALVPNLLAAGAVLGLMGLAGVPLDIMTITIAAITVGIGVDDSIHYLHRFEAEFERHGDYARAVGDAHRSIGRAMYYTSVIIAAGFSVLVLSNFIPTVYFGLFTAFAMLFAMLANLTLLPLLVRRLRPFGPGHPAAAAAGP